MPQLLAISLAVLAGIVLALIAALAPLRLRPATWGAGLLSPALTLVMCSMLCILRLGVVGLRTLRGARTQSRLQTRERAPAGTSAAAAR